MKPTTVLKGIVKRGLPSFLRTGVIRYAFLFILFLPLVFYPPPAFSKESQNVASDTIDAIDEELRYLKAEMYVITPSRIPEKIKKTASSITVITDRQIRQMGARDVMDALDRAVPGVMIYPPPGHKAVIFRGASAHITTLLMINSHPVNELFGGQSLAYDDLIIDNIKRIEVIRGPGSAVYGANAYHGVINVITKEAPDIDGLDLSAIGGSWDTQQYNLLFGKTFSDFEVAFDFNFFKTHGFRAFIEEDGQTQRDQIWTSRGVPSNASLAPGRAKGEREKYDSQLTMKYKSFKFDGKYVDREFAPPVTGLFALSDWSAYTFKDYFLTLSYETRIWEALDLNAKVYMNEYEFFINDTARPPGYIAMTPTGPAIMPNGLITNKKWESGRTGIEIQTTYKMHECNTIVAGATYEHQKAEENNEINNYLVTDVWGVLIPLPTLQKWPDNLTFGTEKRDFWAVFLEDVWDITDDLRLTLGARYDHYSDFGDHFSPRAGLTWEYKRGYDVKLLYGHAFRAPAFREFYSPRIGSTDLEPEKIDTYEISFGAEFTRKFNSRITFYHREEKDLIDASSPIFPWKFVNKGRVRNQGIEIEMRYDFGRGTYIAGNYNYNKMKTGHKGELHQGTIMANFRLSGYLNFYVDWFFISNRKRPLGDTRDDVAGYGIVNATLIAKKFLKGHERLEFRGSVYNLLDKHYRIHRPPSIPNDSPAPGINYLLELRYKF